MSINTAFTKDNLDSRLSKLAKEFRKINKSKIRAEIILIGGAAVLANYDFRDMTYDIDAIINADSSMKYAANKVGDELGLPNGWLNSDFMRTKSYSPKLIQYSVFYKSFGYSLNVRTISSEYLIAMKLMSGRKYKNDISDVIGILYEEKKKGTPLTLEKIKIAVCNLYNEWNNLPEDSINLITDIMQNDELESLYNQYRNSELVTKETLIDFEEKYPNVVNNGNIDDIINKLKSKTDK